uniref:Prolyl endopeptidase n=1 Tax=Coccolithus braarudii TaxID=221442 RepID=A0A7S0Q3P3_9EUKA|mmetsp:Transcript_33939/g.72476  ORF Transcript_33939/g.72476 Transcript_33939/m.72476 type:complete len:770 (+) Transcript_33939:3-2312(+)
MFGSFRHTSRLVAGGCAVVATATAFSDKRFASSLASALPSPPIARRSPHTVYFGKNLEDLSEDRGTAPMDPPIEMIDDLFWLRDDERKNPEILELLHAENTYTDARCAHLAQFREALYTEMLSHVQEDDDGHPAPRADGYEYWHRTVKGQSFKQYLRRKIGAAAEAAQVYLDVNTVPSLPFFSSNSAWDAKQCDVQSIRPSPSGEVLAYCVDGSGYETYDVRLKELSSGRELDESITSMAGDIAWAGDCTLFYTRHNKAHRPHQVWRHALGTEQDADVLVFEDADELFWVGVSTTRDGSLVLIESESKETMEAHIVPTDSPTTAPKVVRPREFGVKYDLDSHAPSRTLFLTSNVDGKRNRELFTASLDTPSQWSPLLSSGSQVLAHSADRSLEYAYAFKDFLAVSGRAEGFQKLWIVKLGEDGRATSTAQPMVFDEEACSLSGIASANQLFDPNAKLRLSYESMTTPVSLLEYDVAAATYSLLKQQPVPNYDKSKYTSKRYVVTARDGEKVPVTLLWRPDALSSPMGDGPNPLHLYGYGSYGICFDPSFSHTVLPLVDRGCVYAIAHVRGGGEMGHHRWYELAGKYLHKRNTFTDFVDCAKALVADGVAEAGCLTCEGRSAGGLLMGAVVNDAPELFTAAVAGVPFVDLMVTMCDPTIPLTCEEWEEWGNPNEAKYHDYMMSYSPIQNVRAGVTYPSLLLVSGLNDPRVAYWEPTKWAQVLRAKIANGEDVLLKMDMAAGHFSASDRYKKLRERAFEWAWLLEQLGKAK